MAGILPPTAKINSAYKKSFYRAGDVSTKINHFPKGILKKRHHSIFVLLSAYNPGGRLKALGWNIRMMKKLEQYLSDYEYVYGEGALKEVVEPLLMVKISPPKAIYLARKFRQNAIVIMRNQCKSKLVFLA